MKEWKMRREEVIKLISYYKKFKCLWDFRSNEYKHYHFKKNAWDKLGKIFGKSASEVKRKVKYLRNAYVAEKKKVDSSYGSGVIYRPNLFYYDDLNFLDTIVIWRNEPKFENCENTTDPIAECNEPINLISCNDECMTDEEDTLGSHLNSSPVPPKSPNSHLRVKKEYKEARQEPYYSKLNSTVDTLQEVTNKTVDKSLYLAFGNTVALQLGQLPQLDAAAAMSEIYQTLSNNIIKSLTTKRS